MGRRIKSVVFYDAYDDYWDFTDNGLKQDIFELVVDGDASGEQFIDQKNWNFKNRPKDQPFFVGEGTPHKGIISFFLQRIKTEV